RIIVGVNKYQIDEEIEIPILKVDEEGERRQIERLQRLRKERDNTKVQRNLERLRKAAEKEDENLMPYILDCVKSYATLGETCQVLRDVFGEYREPILY
ncbi:MAG TPA: methylmalonyl-CoA mutase, partial [Thermoplasmatales archaeon]|nr:methylmalonyl-CoA mutase [Thermoplasmatales archaeon]